MTNSSGRTKAAALLALAVLTACSTATGGPASRTVRPGAPGEETRRVDAAALPETPSLYTEADVRFMQGMIVHHQQALEMASLAPERTDDEDILLLARRIDISQKVEMEMMTDWLEERGEEVPMVGAGHAHHGAGGDSAPMPGMLTEEEMAELAAARGDEFDRLFLISMIRHHQGALAMVEELFATPGAGQEGEIFQFAEHVADGQRVEIDRMIGMLSSG